jgi:predicted AAA+ superfamily ATPase
MSHENDKDLIERLHALLDRVETALPAAPRPPRWERFTAYRWHPQTGLEGVPRPHQVFLDDLLCMDRQKAEVVRNTRQFVAGRPANNVLMWGSRGTGKSSLVKAVFNAFAADGLRLVEVDKADLVQLPRLLEPLHERPERFLIYCDDLSFEAEDASYKALKAVLEGTIAAPPDNVLLYATSNRRHLMPEYMAENMEARPVGGEIHQGESVEEKISLSERFGLWLSFYPFSQDEYLAIVDHWLKRLGMPGMPDEATRTAALRWATQRGSRSGRVARQFALDLAGRL